MSWVPYYYSFIVVDAYTRILLVYVWAQTALCGVVALRYQHRHEVPQLIATRSEPLD